MQSVTPILPHVSNQTDGQNQSLKQSIMTKSPVVVSMHEEMNPSRRCSMEDCCVFAPPGTWDAPSDDMAYLGVYDGHGGTYTIVFWFWFSYRNDTNTKNNALCL